MVFTDHDKYIFLMKTTDPFILMWFGKYVFKLINIRAEHNMMLFWRNDDHFILSTLLEDFILFSTIAFIMWKSFVCKFVLQMLNVFILVHKWFIWMFCYMPMYCIVFYVVYVSFTIYFVRNDKVNIWNHVMLYLQLVRAKILYQQRNIYWPRQYCILTL